MHGETALLVAYVDDLLLCCQTARSEKLVEKAIGKAVPLKETGVILPAEQGGGALTFIGRRIQRGATDDSLSIGVDPKFLGTTFVEFSVNKGSNTVPDVAAVLERALTDKSMQQPLSAAACSRFRRALGKLLWMAQSRHDLKLFLSLIGSQQAAPTHGTEMAIKALLRFLHGDVGTCLRLPSPKYEELMIGAARHCILHSFSDASFAPYRFNGRKGITGGVVFCEGGLVRSIDVNNSQFHFRLAKPSSMHCKLYLKKVWLSANSVRGYMLVWERCNRRVCQRFCSNLIALLHCNCLLVRIFRREAGMWRFVWHG